MKNTKSDKATNLITNETAFNKLLGQHLNWMQGKSTGVQGYIQDQDVSGAIIEDKCFDCMVLQNCNFENSTFLRCSFDGTEFENCNTTGVTAINCNCTDFIPGDPEIKSEMDAACGVVVALG